MIELGLLGLLRDQDLHGYELKKQLTELLGSWSSLSFGSLYPALNRLERAGLVTAVDPDELPEPVVPMTGALSGELAAFRNRLSAGGKGRTGRSTGRRGKKEYRLTGSGRERLTELLLAPGPDDDRTFSLRVAFCRHLPADERLALFERRKAELAAALAQRQARGRRPAATDGRSAGRRADPYLRSLRERDTRALASDLSWLDELIDAARADLAQGAPPASDDLDRPAAGWARSGMAAAALASPSLTTLTARRRDGVDPIVEIRKEGSA
jgi:DNA-binding PadR family transcriptional regulator